MRSPAATSPPPGTLGILIPPSIMLIIMADLMSVSVGNVYMAAWGPGLALVALYVIFVITLACGEAIAGAATAAWPPARAEGGDGASDAQGLPAAGVPDRADQRLDPVRLGDAQRGRRGRRLRRHAAGAVQRPPQLRHDGKRLPLDGTHRRDDLLHHHQRHVLCLRLPLARRRRRGRRPDHVGRPRALGPACS